MSEFFDRLNIVHDERKVHTGQFLDLFEGPQCVGRVLVGKRLNRE